MKKSIYIFFLLITCGILSQETLTKSFSSDAISLEINTEGLDEIKIVNSDSEMIKVSLFDENQDAHHILVDNESSMLKIGFKLEIIEKNNIFKKFIIKRLNRASATIKIPKSKNVSILGTNVDIISESYCGNIKVYIDRGNINLNKVQQNIALNLFQGNVIANFKNFSKYNIDIKSINGKIKINTKIYPKKYKTESLNTKKVFVIYSVNTNIVLNKL